MNRTCIDRYAGPKIKGIDVSHHNGNVNWGDVAQDGTSRFAIIRTGDVAARLGPEDQKFTRNWAGAKSAGVRRGSYQYFRTAYGGIAQADRLLRQLDGAGGSLDSDLPPAIDIEEAGQVTQGDLPLGMAQVLDETGLWLDRVESELGVTPMIYTGQYWHWKASQQGLGQEFARYPLWTPSYGTSCCKMPVTPTGGPGPWSKWTIWQYSGHGAAAGVRGDVDLNYFRGTEVDLARFVASSRKRGALLDSLTPFASAFRAWLR